VQYWQAQLERTQCQFDQSLKLPAEEKQRSLRSLLQWIDRYQKTSGIDPAIVLQFNDLKAKIREAGGL